MSSVVILPITECMTLAFDRSLYMSKDLNMHFLVCSKVAPYHPLRCFTDSCCPNPIVSGKLLVNLPPCCYQDFVYAVCSTDYKPITIDTAAAIESVLLRCLIKDAENTFRTREEDTSELFETQVSTSYTKRMDYFRISYF